MTSEPYVVRERVYGRHSDGREFLLHAVGDDIPREHAEALGLVGKQKSEDVRVEPEGDAYLHEGIEPREGPEADARASGDTAEAMARGGREATAAELRIAESVDVKRRKTRHKPARR